MSRNIPEDASRAPEDPRMLCAVSRAMDPWSRELYRRRNFDEKLCPPVPLPPLPDTLAEWEAERERVRHDFEKCIYGEVPPPPDRLETRLLAEKRDALGGLAIRREIRIVCAMNDGRRHDFDMLLYLPKQAAPAPVFVGLNFNGNQANTPDPDVRLTRGPTLTPGFWWRQRETPDTFRGEKLDSWNHVEAVKRGYAVATACYGEIFPDNPDGFRSSIYRLFHEAGELEPFPPGPAYREFGAISAWAWGLSRMLDALEREAGVDASRAAVLGHSRLGKTALWAGASDTRFKLVISNNSGCLGAAPSRRDFGERLGHLAYIQSFWFSEKMVNYAWREERLPVDQHQLLALVAPRALYVASSSEDGGADPYGEFLSARAASKVWELYGLKGLSGDRQPPLNESAGDMVRYHVKEGPHSITAADWSHYYDFADKLFGARVRS